MGRGTGRCGGTRAAAGSRAGPARRRRAALGDRRGGGSRPAPAELLARLDEVGLVYDTRQVPAPPARPSPLGLAIAEHAGQDCPWLLRVATEPDAASVVAAEAALRLRVLGYAAGTVWEPGPDGDASSAFIPASERAALVCTLDVPLTPDRAAALVRRAQEQGAALVLVGPASAVASAGAGADCPSTWVRAAPEPVPNIVRSAAWPPAREVLTGAPEPGAERELIAAMGVTHRELNHTVRSAASWERPGYLLVFTPERFGWIAVDGRDGVAGAWRLGEPARVRQEADDVLGRVRAMSLWTGSRALFVSATPPLPERAPGPVVLVDTVDLDIRRTLDEARDDRVQPGSLPPDPVGLPPSRIARELLWWGQGRHAQELLQAAERASPWGIEEELLLGYLSAERDPGEAAARLQHAAHRLASDLGGARWGQHVDATLAALLLDVGAHPRAPRTRGAWWTAGSRAWARSGSGPLGVRPWSTSSPPAPGSWTARRGSGTWSCGSRRRATSFRGGWSAATLSPWPGRRGEQRRGPSCGAAAAACAGAAPAVLGRGGGASASALLRGGARRDVGGAGHRSASGPAHRSWLRSGR